VGERMIPFSLHMRDVVENRNALKWVSRKQARQCEEYVDTLVSDKCEPSLRSNT
jgi:hypothetical protein